MVRGTTILGTAVLRVVTTTMRATGTTTTVFGLSVLRRALFCARTGGWEFTGRAEEESRPVPVMLATASENQPRLGSLVSFG